MRLLIPLPSLRLIGAERGRNSVINLTLYRQRCRSATEKIILEDLFSSELSQLKKVSPLWKPENYLLTHFQKLKIYFKIKKYLGVKSNNFKNITPLNT